MSDWQWILQNMSLCIRLFSFLTIFCIFFYLKPFTSFQIQKRDSWFNFEMWCDEFKITVKKTSSLEMMFGIRIELNNHFSVELHRNDCCYDSFIHIYTKSHSKLFMRLVDSWNRLIWVNWKIHIFVSLLFLCCCYYCHSHVNSQTIFYKTEAASTQKRIYWKS